MNSLAPHLQGFIAIIAAEVARQILEEERAAAEQVKKSQQKPPIAEPA